MPPAILATLSQALIDAPLSREAGPLQRQLHDRLKRSILGGHLAPATRLPGSRVLAEALSVSRNTVTAAYDLLAAEGYVHSDRQGTRVAALSRPAHVRRAGAKAAVPVTASRLSDLGTMVPRGHAAAALRPCVPALAQFPLADWRRALDRAVRRGGPAGLGYGEPLGQPDLRATIARHLGLSRGVRCTPDQVVITEGAQEALSLCARLLTNPGDTAWIEDPGYRGAKAAMQTTDVRIVPKRVDAEGLVTTAEDWKHPPRLVYVTPSHQYPTGAVLTVQRRLALIEQAMRHGAWLIEDDYDSEFRHAGEPITAMQGLVEQAPVLYLGTFSKTMFPSLRLGFLVLPEGLLAPLERPLKELLRGGHVYEQLALSAFMESGEFARHLGRMRRLYRDRQSGLRDALTRHFRVPHSVEGGHSGMHLTVRLPSRFPDVAIAAAAARYGLSPVPLSGFALHPLPQDNGLVLGYGNTPIELYEPYVKRLSQLARTAEVR